LSRRALLLCIRRSNPAAQAAIANKQRQPPRAIYLATKATSLSSISRRQIMKKFFISTALILLASPAFAQSYSAGYGTGNVINLPALEHGGFASMPETGAYAYAPQRSGARVHGVRAESISPSDPDTVYVNGEYVGRDPDPNVRLELRRDWMHD
jgi:hypothetical protein